MIVPMQRIMLLCTAGDQATALDRLQTLGVLHVDRDVSEDASLHGAQAHVEAAEEAIRLVTDASGHHDAPAYAGCAPCPEEAGASSEASDKTTRQAAVPASSPVTVDGALKLGKEQSALEAELDALNHEIEQVVQFGDFDPDQARALIEAGLPVTLFFCPSDALPAAIDDGLVHVLSRSDRHVAAVAIGAEIELPERAVRLPMPPVSVMRRSTASWRLWLRGSRPCAKRPPAASRRATYWPFRFPWARRAAWSGSAVMRPPNGLTRCGKPRANRPGGCWRARRVRMRTRPR